MVTHINAEKAPLVIDESSATMLHYQSPNSQESTSLLSSSSSTPKEISISPRTTSSSSLSSEQLSYFSQPDFQQKDYKNRHNQKTKSAWEISNSFDKESPSMTYDHGYHNINSSNYENLNEELAPRFNDRIFCNFLPLSLFSFSKRMKSIYVSIIFCIFFFFYLFKPSEPFLVDFLTDSKGFTQQTVFYKIFPLWVYAHMIAQLIVTLIPEFVSHNFTVFVGMTMAVITIVILLIAKSLVWMQVQQVTVAITFAIQPIAAAALYHTMPCSVYQLVTSLTRACTLLGTVSSSLLGQLLYLHGVPLKYLFVTSLAVASFCAILTISLLPYVPSLRKIRQITRSQKPPILINIKEIISSYYNSFYVSIWSMYSVVIMAVHGLMITYYQNLVKELNPSLTYNGYFIGVAYTLAAIGALLPCRADRLLPSIWTYIVTPAMCTLFPLIMGLCFLGLSIVRSLFPLYSLLVVIHTLFETSVVVAFAQIAKGLKVSRFASIFSLNQTISLVFQFLLQLVVGESVLKLNVRHEFAAFGFVLLALSAVMLMSILGRIAWKCWQQHR